MNTNMTGFRCFSKIFVSLCIGPKKPQQPFFMLRLHLSKVQDHKNLCILTKPCHIGIYWKALVEYYQMSTNVPGFQSYF